ncbi:hypothetical protein DVH05_007427 [Phytophthora capsici]|nr:hypothetical protein DVH05_007427 [Phytophthora capsici]
MEAFRAAGWDLQVKGKLRDLLYQTLTREEVGETKMLVLVGVELTDSMLKYVRCSEAIATAWMDDGEGEKVGANLLKMLGELASLASSGTSKKLVLPIKTEAYTARDREKWTRVIADLVKKN